MTQPYHKVTLVALRVMARSAAFAMRRWRKALRRSTGEAIHWWELPLPKKVGQRAWYGTIPRRIGTIYQAPGWMSPPERVALYAIVYGLRPKRSLEIGTFYGGSAMIIVAALDDIGAGTLECVDPVPRVSPRRLRRIAHRATIHAVPSPEGLAAIAPAPADRFDLSLIDGDHSYHQVVGDIEGTLEVLADDAVILFHDAHYHEVAQAIDAMIEKYPAELVDCGMVSTLEAPENRVGDDGRPVVWGGLRMLRYRGSQARDGGEPPASE